MSATRSNLVLTLVTCFVPLSLALNLVNFFWMDIVFAVITILAFLYSEKNWRSIQTTFGLNNNILLWCLVAYLGSGILGYFFNSPMQWNEWTKIASLRWIFGFFACYAAGHIASKKVAVFSWKFVPLILVMLWIIYRQYNITSGEVLTSNIRMKGFYSNPNYFALAMSLVWAMLLAYVIYTRDCLSRSTAVLTLVLATIALVATYTRTSWLGVACTLLVALIYTKNSRAMIVSALVFGLFVCATYLNLFDLKERLLYTLDFSSTSSQGARLHVWDASWHVFLDHPIFGVGFENSAKLYPDYFVKLGLPIQYVAGHAHNQFLEVLAGAGVIGLAGYLGAFGTGIIFFHRHFKAALETHRKQLALASLLSIVALFACSWTETPFIQHEVRNYILILLGFSYGYLNGNPTKRADPANEPV